MQTSIALNTDFNGSLGDPTTALRQIAGAGFTHLHWCHQWNTDHLYSDREVAKFAQVFKETGLRLLDIHGSDGSAGGGVCCWYATDETYRRAGVELVLNRIRMHAMLRGEGTVMMHIPCLRPNADAATRARVNGHVDALRRTLDELVPICQAFGIPLALENTAGDSFETHAALFKEYPADAVGLCYDSGHGNIKCEDLPVNGIDHFEKFLDRLQALHLNDNDQSGDQHQPPFYGTVDWKRVIAAIRASAYKRIFSFELAMRCTPFADNPTGFLKDAYARVSKAINL